jgi:hypothetical protein
MEFVEREWLGSLLWAMGFRIRHGWGLCWYETKTVAWGRCGVGWLGMIDRLALLLGSKKKFCWCRGLNGMVKVDVQRMELASGCRLDARMQRSWGDWMTSQFITTTQG